MPLYGKTRNFDVNYSRPSENLICVKFLLTCNFSLLTLVDLQLNAQNSYLFIYNTCIKILYMFRAFPCSSSGGLRRNCICAASGIVTVCRWLSCAPVKKEQISVDQLISNLMHKILIYLHIIHILKSSTCFEHFPAYLQEVYVVIVYMQPLVSSFSAGDCLVHRLRKNSSQLISWSPTWCTKFLFVYI